MKELIKKFILSKTASGLSEQTIDSYCYALKDFYQYCMRNNIIEANETDIEAYFLYLRGKQYSNATLRDKYAVLKVFFNYCVNNGFYVTSPVKIKKPALPARKARCFTDEEIATIMRYYAIKDTFCKLRDYTIIFILFGTGIRRAELLNITAANGDFLTVIGKGNKERLVPVSRGLKAVLKEYITERNKIAVCPFLIVTKSGQKMTKNGLRAVFTRLSAATGIGGKRFSAHTWRHTFATCFLRNGGDICSLQRMLGHADIQTTAIYLNWTDETTKNVNDRVNPLNNFKFFF